jgi:transcriptional regulator of nitric oxide reductase
MTVQKKLGFAGALICIAVALIGLSQVLSTPEGLAAIERVTTDEEALFKEVFPPGEAFSTKEGRYPHYKAYVTNPDTGEPEVTGLVFYTVEIEPDEFGYESRLEFLVGMTTGGTITGIKLIDHFEPFGYFSIEPEEFAEQFDQKSILDRFEQGRDIEAISRATITIDSAARVIRLASRKIARQYLEETQQ